MPIFIDALEKDECINEGLFSWIKSKLDSRNVKNFLARIRSTGYSDFIQVCENEITAMFDNETNSNFTKNRLQGRLDGFQTFQDKLNKHLHDAEFMNTLSDEDKTNLKRYVTSDLPRMHAHAKALFNKHTSHMH